MCISRTNRTFTIRNKAHPLYSNLLTILQEIGHMLFSYFILGIVLQKPIAELTAHITRGGQGHIYSYRSYSLAAFPCPDSIMVPIYFRTIEVGPKFTPYQLIDMFLIDC